MKNVIAKIITIISILGILFAGLVPSINQYLKERITYNQYLLLIEVLLLIIFITFLYTKMGKQATLNLKKLNIEFKKIDKEVKYKEKQDYYYREIPFNNDLFKTLWIAYQYDIIKNKTNIINALILKWYLEKRIEIVSKNKYVIINEQDFSSYHEESLFKLLKHKRKNEFKRINIFNSTPILNKIDEILNEETIIFQNQNKITTKNNHHVINETITEDIDKVYGLKNFLLNFSTIDEKSLKEIVIWEEYLIYAELFGITKKVKKELTKLNINYSIKEAKFKKVNNRIISFFKILLFISYLFYIILIVIFTSPIVMIYTKLTWN